MIASGLLKFRHCCALKLEGNIQVEIIPIICVSSEGRIMPCCTIFPRLPTSACASRHARRVPCWITFNHSYSNVVPINKYFIDNEMTAA